MECEHLALLLPPSFLCFGLSKFYFSLQKFEKKIEKPRIVFISYNRWATKILVEPCLMVVMINEEAISY